MSGEEIVPMPSVSLVKISEVPGLLREIRPAWRDKHLIARVRKLLTIDPSSACQRVFNAAMHDLREKVVLAGIDIAYEAAKQHKLPPVNNPDDLSDYPIAKLIDLAYRMGLLTRPEWRRVHRCYEIRRDLEHEDDEYEAGIEDCIYIFKTCVEVFLSRDPISLLKITDVKEVIEEPLPVTPDQSLLSDFQHAPQPRQEEIHKFLMSYALDTDQAEIVQQNAFAFISRLAPLTQDAVKLKLTGYFQEKMGRRKLDRRHARVAYAMGILPYLKRAQRADFFDQMYAQMQKVGPQWTSHPEHGELLRSLNEIGGLEFCPPEQKKKIIKWLVLCYLGERGGRTSWGNIREVFYSNTGAPLAWEILKAAGNSIAHELLDLSKDSSIKGICTYPPIARRFESLLDLVESVDR